MPTLSSDGSGYALVGINTFTEGFGGRFGDTGRGIRVTPYQEGIKSTMKVLEPSGMTCGFLSRVMLVLCRFDQR